MPKYYRLQSFLSIQYVHGDLCKHLGIDSSTDHPDVCSVLYQTSFVIISLRKRQLVALSLY